MICNSENVGSICNTQFSCLKHLKPSSTAALHGELRHDLYNIFESRSISSAEKVSDDIPKSLVKIENKLGNAIGELPNEDLCITNT